MLARRHPLALAGGAPAGAVLPSGPAAAAPGSPAVPLPAPTGPLAIGRVALHLVDRRHRDPLAPGDRFREPPQSSVPAELMAQLWHPARRAPGPPPSPRGSPPC